MIPALDNAQQRLTESAAPGSHRLHITLAGCDTNTGRMSMQKSDHVSPLLLALQCPAPISLYAVRRARDMAIASHQPDAPTPCAGQNICFFSEGCHEGAISAVELPFSYFIFALLSRHSATYRIASKTQPAANSRIVTGNAA